VRVAVVQHRIRTHERMDLAAMLAVSERASEEGAQVIVYPAVPGVSSGTMLVPAFLRNVEERAPGMTAVSPFVALREGGAPAVTPTALGRTLVLTGDECIDPSLFAEVQALACEALVWQFDAEDDLQSEACLELALEASLTLAPLMLVASVTGSARGIDLHGTSAIVYLGEILAEGGAGEDLLIADVPAPSVAPEHGRRLPEPAPILRQRLAAHHGTRVPVDYPSDLS
jgi:hypothetical protein